MKTTLFWCFLLAFALYSCGESSEATSNASTADVSGGSKAPASEQATPKTATDSLETTSAPTVIARQSSAAAPTPFETKLTEGPVTFIVQSPNSTPNFFTLNTEGMTVRNEETKIEVNGRVVRAATADLNQDNYPEVYIITQTEEDIEEIYAFASYRNRSYGQIHMAKADNDASFRGNAGGSTYELQETKLIRRHTITQNGQRTGEAGTVEYVLKKGETSYRLEPVE